MKPVHTFAVCAYGKSPYLETCIRSVLRQSQKTRVILCTSTPNGHIETLADKYNLPLFIRQGASSLQEDWNFAYEKADTSYVTLTHQDDIYHRDYARETLRFLRRYPDTLITMTDYKIINEKNQARGDISLLVKQLLKLPLRIPFLADKQKIKTGVQSLGNPICCPSVCYHKERIQAQRQGAGHREPEPLFQSGMEYALDWEAFYQLARLKGRFTYIPKTLFYYRIHQGTATKKCLRGHKKTEEEIRMFRKFWPRWAAEMIMRGYRFSYRSYGK